MLGLSSLVNEVNKFLWNQIVIKRLFMVRFLSNPGYIAPTGWQKLAKIKEIILKSN